MFSLRCTQKLLKRMKVRPEPEPPLATPTSALGDWYANLLFFDRRQLVLCCSERTFLPVVLPAREINSLVSRLRVGLAEILTAIGAPATAIDEELASMGEHRVCRTSSKVVLGVMNDFAWQLECMTEASMLELSLALGKAPLGPLKMENALRASLEVLSEPRHLVH